MVAAISFISFIIIMAQIYAFFAFTSFCEDMDKNPLKRRHIFAIIIALAYGMLFAEFPDYLSAKTGDVCTQKPN